MSLVEVVDRIGISWIRFFGLDTFVEAATILVATRVDRCFACPSALESVEFSISQSVCQNLSVVIV